MRSYQSVTCIVATSLGACAGNPQPIPVVGDAASVASLAGKWEGTDIRCGGLPLRALAR